MAKIWYAREGQDPTLNGPRCELPFENCKQLFRSRGMDFLGTDTPRFASSNPKLDRFREPRFVVVELTEKDSATDKAEGFYRLDIDVNQCEGILRGSGL